MKATWAETANCDALTATDPFVINKRSLTVHKADTKVYNGSEQTMAITAGDIQEGTSLAADETLTISASIKGTDVGTYTTLAEGSEWKVTKGEADVTGNYDITVTGQLTITKAGSAQYQGSVTLDDWTYGDEAKAEVSRTTGGDYAAPSYAYKKADASDDTYTSEKPSEAGSYIVKATWAETANCDALTATDTFVIAKRLVTVTAEDASKTYDATPLVKNASKITSGELVSGHSYEATIEGSQTLVGNSQNIVTDVKVYDADKQDVTANYDIVKAPGTLTVTDGTPDKPVDPNKVVTKTHEDKTYGLGDTIVFNIEVTNIYNEAKTITISEQEGVTITGQSVFENVAPGAKVSTTAEYVVTETDLLAGTFTNKVTASFDGGKDFENTDTVDKFEDPKGHLTITKDTTSKPANGETYALGETITYRITAENDGNLTLTNVVVTDELTGDEWNVESLAPGENKEFTATYVVTEDDVLAGRVVNEATGTATSPDPETPPTIVPGEKEEPTDPKNGHLTITKDTTSTPANGEAYALGETITYKITATNDGNLTLTNVEVVDELTGDKWTVESIAPGESKDFTAEYIVKEADILAGSVVNVATATGESPDPDKPDPGVDPGEKEEPTDPKNGHLTITKDTTSTPANGEAYALGETITYKITATNDGNLTLTNVEVVDELTGDKWTVESIAPGESKDFTAEYIVKEADILAGSVVNVATATGESPDPDKPDPGVDPGEKEEPTDPKNGHLTLAKAATSTPANGTAYSAGETVTYRITAANDGNLTLTNVEVTDELTGDVWMIESLAPGESREFTTAYVVTEADVLAGSVVNVATADGESPDPDKPDPEVDPDEEVVPTNRDYTVTIHYIDANGNTVAPDYTGTFTYQTPFSVTSPVIDGYTPSAAVVNGTMPAENIEYVVIYTAEDVPVIVPPVPVPTPTPTPNPEPIVNTPEVPETETPETEETDDNAGYDLSVVDDEEVPLADMNDNHKCCILHFLILCLGLLIEIWYTHDQKKRQKKIFELREMLAEQTNGEIR